MQVNEPCFALQNTATRLSLLGKRQPHERLKGSGQVGPGGAGSLLVGVLASVLLLLLRPYGRLFVNSCDIPKPSSALLLPLERPVSPLLPRRPPIPDDLPVQELLLDFVYSVRGAPGLKDFPGHSLTATGSLAISVE